MILKELIDGGRKVEGRWRISEVWAACPAYNLELYVSITRVCWSPCLMEGVALRF